MTNVKITVTYGDRAEYFELEGAELSLDSGGNGYLTNASRGFIADEVESILNKITKEH